MRLLFTALACLFSVNIFSQTTFTGANNTIWSDAGNWSNGLPSLGNEGTIPAGMSVVNEGYIDNIGDINNYGTISNEGYIDNNWTIINEGNIGNDGTIINDGTIYNNGAIDNNGLINNSNEGTIQTSENGNIENDGIIENYGYINNLFGAIDNNTLIDNFGLIFNDNDGTINNNGLIENNGLIDNSGTIDNFGTIDQCGTWLGSQPQVTPYTTANCPLSGCTYEAACNYNPSAELDDNTCLYIGDSCDDGDSNTLDDEIQEDCECSGTPNSVVDELEALSVLIYPNPASNNLTVDLGDLNEVNTTIKLYDSSSKLVFEKQSTSTLTLDVSDFAKGMYSLELSTDEKVLRSQVLVE